MRSLAEERKEGTFEFLATRPITDWQVVLGKYFACLLLVLLALIPTLIYVFSVDKLGLPEGNFDAGAIIGSYIGLFLIGGVFVSIGIFASSITKNQIIAFTIAVFISFFMFNGFDSVSGLLLFQNADIQEFGINAHYEAISRGVLDTRDLIYFLSVIVLFLLLTKTVLGGRKW